jgi:hypothetical protein
VTRKWLATIVSAEETSTQIQVVFTDALEAEGLLDDALARGQEWVNLSTDDGRRPILLAVSDNGGADDLRVHAGVHGDVRDRGSTSAAPAHLY